MSPKSKSHTGIAAAVAAAGTQDKLAKDLGVTQPAVQKWCKQGWVPLMRAGQIEALYNISRTRLANPKIVALLGTTSKAAT
ncbi:Putative antitoxin of toxin-antitoxin system, YdaS/YdaT [Duganella sp. CF517]|uniref:Cro/CI family transcriptional regulator n=1 Tax=Duganella sp. CF517 TaxID=1881038 RepID=UPI0008B41242|nr:Cro/CI family transcriptional regulator [Duganella sp. CF517]SEN31681.1 Putative antitoxin of toxin-antitoxin system, YdaS/YdaT [Duganella sp. CF517]